MKKVGQILYDVETYINNQRVFISSEKNSTMITNVIINSQDNLDYEQKKVDIFSNIIPRGIYLIKIGVQAIPGTRMIINDKHIIVGRTGIYELDANIPIDSLLFERPIDSNNKLKNIIIDFIYEQ